MVRNLYRNRTLRSFALPVLRLVNRDIKIRHHWTGQKIRLNLFRHKGYWFHGRRRELREMQAFEKLIDPLDVVAEVGGHIGYLSLWFAELTREGGWVFVFEPGDNNLPYLRDNLASIGNVTIIESGCGEISGELEFYQDDLTGQNNSFVPDFSGLQANAEFAPGLAVHVKKRLAPVVRLDEFFTGRGKQPGFVKIDTEGYELTVLKGCQGLLTADKRRPKFMVEVQADGKEIYQLFTSNGYKIYSSAGTQIIDAQNMRGNLFMLHTNDHSIEAERWLNHQAAI